MASCTEHINPDLFDQLPDFESDDLDLDGVMRFLDANESPVKKNDLYQIQMRMVEEEEEKRGMKRKIGELQDQVNFMIKVLKQNTSVVDTNTARSLFAEFEDKDKNSCEMNMLRAILETAAEEDNSGVNADQNPPEDLDPDQPLLGSLEDAPEDLDSDQPLLGSLEDDHPGPVESAEESGTVSWGEFQSLLLVDDSEEDPTPCQRSLTQVNPEEGRTVCQRGQKTCVMCSAVCKTNRPLLEKNFPKHPKFPRDVKRYDLCNTCGLRMPFRKNCNMKVMTQEQFDACKDIVELTELVRKIKTEGLGFGV